MVDIVKIIQNPEETRKLGEAIGSRLRGGECIEFSSDLGGGKTTMTQSIVAGAGSTDIVTSPTFTIGKQYSAPPNLKFYHYDFYRLQDPGLVAEELAEALENSSAVIIVEWAQTVQDVLPAQRVHIEIMRDAENSEQRKLQISCPEKMGYLFNEEPTE